MNFYECYTIIPFSAKEQDVVRSNTITRDSHGSEGPPEKKTNVNRVKTHINKWAQRTAQPKKVADEPMGPTAFRL